MKLTNKDVVAQCLERIEFIQQHQKNVSAAVHHIHSRAHGSKQVDTGDIMSRLFDQELTEWRNLAMWGLTLDDDERDRIKAAAHARFLHDGMHVANWLNSDGVSPGSWLKADEDEFRAMAKAAFAPKASAD